MKIITRTPIPPSLLPHFPLLSDSCARYQETIWVIIAAATLTLIVPELLKKNNIFGFLWEHIVDESEVENEDFDFVNTYLYALLSEGVPAIAFMMQVLCS